MTGIWKRSGKRDDPSPRGLPDGRAPTGEGSPGFTLIEVMVALSILAITFVVILGLQNRDILQHQEARYLTRATLLAQQKISEVEMAGFPALGISNGGFPEPDEIFDWTETVTSTPFEYAREVRVEVGWKEGSRRDSVTLITFVMEEK